MAKRFLVKSEKVKIPNAVAFGISGATDPIRTDDLLITSELLYLLSHSSIFRTDTVYQVYPLPSREKCKRKAIMQKNFKKLGFFY